MGRHDNYYFNRRIDILEGEWVEIPYVFISRKFNSTKMTLTQYYCDDDDDDDDDDIDIDEFQY
jgi:hypothetical protein